MFKKRKGNWLFDSRTLQSNESKRQIRIIARTAPDENAKLKHNDELLLDQRKPLISMNMKLPAGQPACQNRAVAGNGTRRNVA
jgi:hypothetical protein